MEAPTLKLIAFDPNRKHGNRWNGGRRINTWGYVVLSVGKEHPLADKRGEILEHRLIMSQILGRPLAKKEIVHHKDGNTQNNDPSNLELCKSQPYHKTHHRKRSDLKMPEEKNYLISCACGCGRQLYRYDEEGRPRQYIHGHNGHFKTRLIL